MKTFDFIQATVSHILKDPHSKALEPDCLFPFASDYDTVSEGEGKRYVPPPSRGRLGGGWGFIGEYEYVFSIMDSLVITQ